MTRRKRKTDRWVDAAVDALVDGDPLPAGPPEDPEDLDELRAAIAVRAARPGADLPREEFLTSLSHRLDEVREPVPPRRTLSRRALLTTAGVGAASVAAGAAGVLADRTLLAPAGNSVAQQDRTLVPVDSEWLAVATAADLSTGAPTRFATPAVVGFVSQRGNDLVAVSGVCTHLGCLLQANTSAGRLDCPCHRTAFGVDGRVLFSQLSDQPNALPTMSVRRQGDAIEVLVPRQA